MTRRLPILATALVALAVATMIALGLWQVQRAEWKEGIIARYASAAQQPPIPWPTDLASDTELPLYRRASGQCVNPQGITATAGQNRAGESGYVFLVDCADMRVELGWSKDPKAAFAWPGGAVAGVIAPDRRAGMRLVADQAPAGLLPSARPSLAAISNNHRLYAVQWFAFAAIALVIYGLALRSRLRPSR